MCKQRNQSGADSKQNCHGCEMKVRYDVIVTKKRLFIEHKLVSIGGRENHDKEQFNGTGAEVGLRIFEWVG